MNCPYCDQECEETEVNNKVVYYCIPCRQDFKKTKTGLEDRINSYVGSASPLDEWLARNSIIANREAVQRIRKALNRK